jgi:hypothetical protein
MDAQQDNDEYNAEAFDEWLKLPGARDSLIEQLAAKVGISADDLRAMPEVVDNAIKAMRDNLRAKKISP